MPFLYAHPHSSRWPAPRLSRATTRFRECVTEELARMGLLLVVALILAVFGMLGIFVFPWVGGPLLVIAVVLGVVALFVGGPAAAVAAADDDVGFVTEEAPQLPGPGDP